MNPKSRKSIRFSAYMQLICNGREPFVSQHDYAERLGVSRITVARWDRVIDWEAVKMERRKAFAKRMIPVDDAMFKAASAGDVAAAKFVAERYDGYVPTEKRVSVNEGTDDELRRRAEEIDELLRKPTEGSAHGDMPGAGTA